MSLLTSIVPSLLMADQQSMANQYLLASTSAHDALFAIQASLAAFLDHLDTLADGYQGSIAKSPSTNAYSGTPGLILPIFPDFELSRWLAPRGITQAQLLKQFEGGIGIGTQLYLAGEQIYREDYNETWYADAHAQGASLKSATFQDACAASPSGDLEYLVGDGTGYVPTLDAARPIWLEWIEDQFEGRALEKSGCIRTDLASFLLLDRYQSVGNSCPRFAGLAEFSYDVPLGLCYV
ncbi:hypothetical protein GGR53DRAFT_465890 [Hypoxylon sp. FL1150]|nr:hypothetical protein GGR53DRAFT_465890 [Hypoxylon sp. FL1150]